MNPDHRALQRVTGSLALGFGVYCIALGVFLVLFEPLALSLLLGILAGILGAIYLAFGLLTLMARAGQSGIFLFAGAFASTGMFSGGIPWYLLPLFIVPWVLLVLAVLLLMYDLGKMRSGKF